MFTATVHTLYVQMHRAFHPKLIFLNIMIILQMYDISIMILSASWYSKMLFPVLFTIGDVRATCRGPHR